MSAATKIDWAEVTWNPATGYDRISPGCDHCYELTLAKRLKAAGQAHWHPTNEEWQYYIAGQGQMTVFASSGRARTFDYQAGDVGYVPFAMVTTC